MTTHGPVEVQSEAVTIPAGVVHLEGELVVPSDAGGMVIFAHGSGSSRFSPRNQYVAALLHRHGLGTLLMDLLTPAEEAEDEQTATWRFDVDLLARRVVNAIDWLLAISPPRPFPIGLFGASTGAAAALLAAEERPHAVRAVVSRGGRPDLAGAALRRVCSPTLLIVGGQDNAVLALNRKALAEMHCPRRLAVVPDAAHLFEEPGTLQEAAELAAGWFVQYLPVAPSAARNRRCQKTRL